MSTTAADSFPLDLLACPACHAPLAAPEASAFCCTGCDARYDASAPADLVPSTLRPALAGDDRDVSWSRWHEAIRGLEAWRGRRAGPVRHDDGARDADVDALFERAKVRGVVVDVGAKDGGRRALLAREGVRYIGIDPLPQARSSALGADDALVRGLAEALPVASAVADAVVCLAAFDYFADPHAAVAEMARVLRPGGMLALMVSVVSPTVAHARGDRSRFARITSAVRAARDVGLGATAGLVSSALLERDRPHTHYYTRAQCTSMVGVKFELEVVREVPQPASTIVYFAGRKRKATRLPVIR